MDAASFSRRYIIPADRIANVRKLISRVNKRAAKLEMPKLALAIGELKLTPMRKTVVFESQASHESVVVMAAEVELTGSAPRLHGYEFVGRLDYVDGTDEPLVMGPDVPATFGRCAPTCDHCRVARGRKSTLVLRESTTDRYLQVGTSCLKDFFGGEDPFAQLAMLTELVDVLHDMDEMEYDGDGEGSSYPTTEVLAIASAVIRTNGYTSKARAEESFTVSTADLVRSALARSKDAPSRNEGDANQARQVLEWLQSEAVQSARGESTYMHNLAVLGMQERVRPKHVGILASAVPAYTRAISQQIEQAYAAQSEYVGKPGERIEAYPVIIVGKAILPGYMDSTKTLYRLRDDNGNLLVWFNSGREIGEVGDRVHIAGMVKKHEPYRDVKQTTLLRVTTTEQSIYGLVSICDPKRALKKHLKGPVNLEQLHVDDQLTPLMRACRDGATSMVHQLLDAGANPNTRDREGHTAAHFAAAQSFHNCLSALAEAGCDLEHPADDGSNAISLTAEDSDALADDVRKYSTTQISTDRLRWNRDAEFPISTLQLPADLQDWFIEQCAKHEEEGRGQLRGVIAQQLQYFPVVIGHVDGIPAVLAGLEHIAYALSEKAKTIPALVGMVKQEDPEIEVARGSNDHVQSNEAVDLSV